MENSLKKRKKKKGFTLVELVIVLAVMGIIALIAIPSLKGTKDNFKIKADKESCKTIKRAIDVLVAGEAISEKGNVTVKYIGGKATLKDGKDLTKDLEDAVENALQDVKDPQSEDSKGYLIEVDNGKVTITVCDADGNQTTKKIFAN